MCLFFLPAGLAPVLDIKRRVIVQRLCRTILLGPQGRLAGQCRRDKARIVKARPGFLFPGPVRSFPVGEDALRDQAVHAQSAIDSLGDHKVDRHA